MTPSPKLLLYGAPASGAVSVEAALTLVGAPYELIDGETWTDPQARDRVAPANAMRQLPTLVLPDGEVMTESAAILIYLADLYPSLHLAPPPEHPARRQFLRWMLYVSSAIYALHWIKPDVRRIGVPASMRQEVVDAVHERIAFCWAHMDAQLSPGPWLLGDELSVLDLYVAVVSRFGPWRERFHQAAPRMTPAILAVDRHPRLQALWARRFPEG
jgi:GST-like protein